jgi:hypothetical protein
MIHMGQTISPLPKLLALLKPGDIVSHMFAPPPNSIIDAAGHILTEVTTARRRGVRFDLGKWAQRPFGMGYGRTRAEGGLPAGPFVHRFDSGGPDRPSYQLSKRYVEVPDAGHRPGGRVHDFQCVPGIPGLPQPRNAKGGRAGGHCRARLKGRELRVRG